MSADLGYQVPANPPVRRWPRIWRMLRIVGLVLVGGALFVLKIDSLTAPAPPAGSGAIPLFQRATRASPALLVAVIFVEILCFTLAWLESYAQTAPLRRARRIAYGGLAAALLLSGGLLASAIGP